MPATVHYAANRLYSFIERNTYLGARSEGGLAARSVSDCPPLSALGRASGATRLRVGES